MISTVTKEAFRWILPRYNRPVSFLFLSFNHYLPSSSPLSCFLSLLCAYLISFSLFSFLWYDQLMNVTVHFAGPAVDQSV
jgi:hypothetical protein